MTYITSMILINDPQSLPRAQRGGAPTSGWSDMSEVTDASGVMDV